MAIRLPGLTRFRDGGLVEESAVGFGAEELSVGYLAAGGVGGVEDAAHDGGEEKGGGMGSDF